MSQKDLLIDVPIEFKGLYDTFWREAAIYGGRYSLKSHTVGRYLITRAREKKRRIGCFREFQNSISDSSHQLLADLIKFYGLTDFEVTNNSIINKLTGSDFLFKGLYQNEQSIKSIEGMDIAWVEEAQTVSTSSIEILTPTVRKDGSQIIYTYNRLLEDDPIHTRLVVEGRPNTLIINVNYDVAIKYGYMPEVIRMEMEDDKLNRPALYKHKWLGEPNSLEARIYKEWKIIDEMPHEAQLISYGLDFGYTNDPSSIVEIYYYNGGYIFNEVAFSKGLSNKQIADILKSRKVAPTIADSAEPKSIDELRYYGLTVLPATKGKGSVAQRIQFVQAQRCSVTKSSVNILREYKNYSFELDRNGKVTNVPRHEFSHGMDAISYGMQIKRSTDKPSYQQAEWENPMQSSYAEDDFRPRPLFERITPTFKQPEYESPLQGGYEERTTSAPEGLRDVL